MKTLLFLLLSCLHCLGAEVTLQWFANPPEEEVTEYRIWRQTGPDVWTLQAATAPDVLEITLTLSAGRHTFALSTVNAWGESDRGEPITTPAAPTPPKGGKVKGIRITLQMSRDLLAWKPVFTAEVPWEQSAQFRAVFTH